MKILIDNAAGEESLFRRSPDRAFYEWQYNRELAIGIVEKLTALGYDAERLVLEDSYDVPKRERIRRVNKFCSEEGKKNVILIGLRGMRGSKNANCEWVSQRGFCAIVNHKADEASKELARCLVRLAEEKGFASNKRKPTSNDLFRYEEMDVPLAKHSKCVAVTTENLCYCNKEDAKFLKNEFTKGELIDIHVQGLINFLNRDKEVRHLHPDIKESDVELWELKDRLNKIRLMNERICPIAIYR